MTAFDNLTSIPCAITAGEAVIWTETPADYPPASYNIAYKFAGQTPQDGFQQFSITGSESGSTYTFTFATTIKPGVYNWEKWVTRSSDSATRSVCKGSIIVRANLGATPTVTDAAAQLALINAAILTLTTTVDSSVSFNGQSFTKADLGRMQEARIRLQAEVYREQQRIAELSGEGNNPVIGTRFLPQPGVWTQPFPYLNRPW
jgi:hypothetical protein